MRRRSLSEPVPPFFWACAKVPKTPTSSFARLPHPCPLVVTNPESEQAPTVTRTDAHFFSAGFAFFLIFFCGVRIRQTHNKSSLFMPTQADSDRLSPAALLVLSWDVSRSSPGVGHLHQSAHARSGHTVRGSSVSPRGPPRRLCPPPGRSPAPRKPPNRPIKALRRAWDRRRHPDRIADHCVPSYSALSAFLSRGPLPRGTPPLSGYGRCMPVV